MNHFHCPVCGIDIDNPSLHINEFHPEVKDEPIIKMIRAEIAPMLRAIFMPEETVIQVELPPAVPLPTGTDYAKGYPFNNSNKWSM